MVITALSQSTRRAVGSGQVLADPIAVVKELVENALDAHSTSISVQVSPNTLDFIQVRDNGHGITPIDRPLVVRRHCTSKITSEGDIRVIGGSSLGFRGEALASAAELSGSLTITTRVEGEQAAVVLSFNPQGEVEETGQSSSSVGTTVQVFDFLVKYPVRRQASQKQPERCVKDIKHLIQSYALARPNVRLSFQVLNIRSTKHNLVYAPGVSSDAKDAAFKLLGTLCARQCTWSCVTERCFHLRSLLPKLNAEPGTVSGFGSYISIDARPVSSFKEVAKRITKSFREVLKQVTGTVRGTKNPFLYLEIECPAGSYDVNVEPSKDDVLFENPEFIFGVAENMFRSFYGLDQNGDTEKVYEITGLSVRETSSRMKKPDTAVVLSSQGCLDFDDDSDVLSDIIRKRTPELSADQDDFIPSHDSPKRSSLFIGNMGGHNEDGTLPPDACYGLPYTAVDPDEVREADIDIALSNPWILAKLNASQRPNRHEECEVRSAPTATIGLISKDVARNSECSGYEISNPNANSLPSTWSSSLLEHKEYSLSNGVSANRSGEDGNVHRNGLFSQQRQFSAPFTEEYQVLAKKYLTVHKPIEELRSGSTSTFPVMNSLSGTPLTQIPDVRDRRYPRPKKNTRGSGFRKPFITLTKNWPRREKVWFDHLENPDNVHPQPNSKLRKLQRHDLNPIMKKEYGLLNKSQALLPLYYCHDTRAAACSNSSTEQETFQVVNQPQSSQEFTTGSLVSVGDTLDSVKERSCRGYELISPDETYTLSVSDGSPTRLSERDITGHCESWRISKTDASDMNKSPVSTDLKENFEGSQVVRNTAFSCRGSPKCNRGKQLHLALENLSAEQCTQDVIQVLTVSVPEIAKLPAKLSVEYSLPRSSNPKVGMLGSFVGNEPDLRYAAEKLCVLLSNTHADSRGVDADYMLNKLQAAFCVQPEARSEHDEMLDV